MNRLRSYWPIAVLVLFALLVFRDVLPSGMILETTDDNIGEVALRQRDLPDAFLGNWRDIALAGVPVFMHICWTNLLMWILPTQVFASSIHAFDLLLGSLCLYAFLGDRGLSRPARILAGLVCCWLGSTFFLIYAGHIGKFGTVAMACLGLWLVNRGISRGSPAYSFLGGSAWGAMFLEQPDSGLFFAGPLCLWALFEARGTGTRFVDWGLKRLLPVAVGCVLFAIHPALESRSLYGGTAPGEKSGNSDATWNYATQWSWPPDETIEWIAPGYMGWRSGEPQGPYWGKLGRDPQWSPAVMQTAGFQGFNFKLETFYIGVIPCLLALFSIVFCLRGTFMSIAIRRDVLIWSLVALVTFLLGLGKFLEPLYRLFFMIPGMSSIRNPVKFMQVTQLALAVLSAYGFDAVMKSHASADGIGLLRRCRWIALALFVVLFLAFFSAALGEADHVSAFRAQGWGDFASAIVTRQIWGLGWAAGMSFILFIYLIFSAQQGAPWMQRRSFMGWGLVLLIMVDQLAISRHYVRAVKADMLVGSTPLIDKLKAVQGEQRVNFVGQDQVPVYGHWLTYAIPYHHILSMNVTQIRMPADYQAFLSHVGRQPDLLWRQFAVGYLVLPSSILPQLQQLGTLKDSLELLMAFNTQGSSVIPVPAGQRSEHVLMKCHASSPRYALIGGWRGMSRDKMLDALGDPSSKLFESVLLNESDAARLPASVGTGIVGEVRVDSYKSGRVVLKTTTKQDAVLRISENYSPHWKAYLDQRSVPVMSCDFLFQGVFVPAGDHEVVLNYAPPLTTLGVQFAGMGLCVLSISGLLLRRFLPGALRANV